MKDLLTAFFSFTVEFSVCEIQVLIISKTILKTDFQI